MTITYSFVGMRRGAAKTLRNAANSEELGLITDVKLLRLSWLIWHLEFKAEYKGSGK